MAIDSKAPERQAIGTLRSEERLPDTALLSVVIPTRNEAANVEPLLARLASALEGIDHELIFVDDSDDGTLEALSAHATRNGRRLVLHHRKPGEREAGLSGAVIEGLKLATGTHVAVIDADLQHPPELLPRMLARSQSRGADIVVASRYVEGGSVNGLGDAARKLLSQGTRWFSRGLFHERIWNVQDPCSGFFIFRRALLENIELRPIGYKILLEVLMRTPWDFLDEVPYRFEERAGGASKASIQQGLLFLRHALRLFRELPSAGRVWKFLLVGATGAVVNLALLWLVAVELGAGRTVGWPIALEASVISNFLLNRTFTWNDRRAHGPLGVARDGLRYHLAMAFGLGVSTAAFAAFSWLGLPILAAGLGGIVLGAATNFIGSDRFVFVARRRQTTVRRVAESALTEGAARAREA